MLFTPVLVSERSQEAALCEVVVDALLFRPAKRSYCPSRRRAAWSRCGFRDHHATALGVLIIRATRHTTVCWSAQRRPPCRQLLCNLSHPATKKLRRSDVRAWRGNVATLVHI